MALNRLPDGSSTKRFKSSLSYRVFSGYCGFLHNQLGLPSNGSLRSLALENLNRKGTNHFIQIPNT